MVILRVLQGVGAIQAAFLPRDVDLLSQQLESVSLADPGQSAGDASSTRFGDSSMSMSSLLAETSPAIARFACVQAEDARLQQGRLP